MQNEINKYHEKFGHYPKELYFSKVKIEEMHKALGIDMGNKIEQVYGVRIHSHTYKKYWKEK